MKLRKNTVLWSSVLAGSCVSASAATAQQEYREINGWTVQGRSDGTGSCSLSRSSSEGLLRYDTNGNFYVAGGAIGEVDTRRPTSLVLVINDTPEQVRARASFKDGEYGYSFSPRQRPPFARGFDLEVRRGDDLAFSYQVRNAKGAYDDLLDCESNPFWPELF